jgi:hypothetical protein
MKPSCTLFLVLTYHWFDETERGAKCIEYRAMSHRWKKQIWDRREQITHVKFARGYTSRMLERPVIKIDTGTCPLSGWDDRYYRIHFVPNQT